MKNFLMQKYIQGILDKADIAIDGNRPQDIKILNENALKQIVRDGSLGLGETYMAGWWDCKRIDELSYRLCKAAIRPDIKFNPMHFLHDLSTKFINYQSKRRSRQVAYKHYNIDNTLFEKMLGESMAYSCGYWKGVKDLTSAQMAKYDLICRKLQLTSQDTLLDVGCGWGGLAAFAAEHYGCHVVGISIASKQIDYAKARYKHLPIDFYTADYRDVASYNPKQKQFSKMASVGAFEHIGHKNHQTFMRIMNSQLSEDGIFLLHTIGANVSATTVDPWFDKYIFPNGCLPSMVQLTRAIESLFLVEDWHNFGQYYDQTLLAWDQNFQNNWHLISSHYDMQFYRMWRYYLLMCAGMFRSRTAQLWQIVLSKSGLIGGYESVR